MPLTVTGASPSRGSTAGGLAVTISGTGFSTTASDNTVSFGGIPCTVTAATQTSLTCVTGPNPSAGSSAASGALVASALPSAAPATFASVTFSYDPAVTDALASINTTRGSTAGCTPLLISGTFLGAQADYTIRMGSGGATCSITSFNATTITCT